MSRSSTSGPRQRARDRGAVGRGALAKRILARDNIEVVGYIQELMGIPSKASDMGLDEIKATIEETPVRCPDVEAAKTMMEETLKIKEEGDTCGGVIEFRAVGVPPGVGEPAFDKLSARIAYGLMSIPSVKGCEIGDGFESAKRKGSEDNDLIGLNENGRPRFETNHAGGILGGISNGDEIRGRAAVKPTSTISIPQKTINMMQMEETTLSPITRRDPTICGRAVPVVEAMVRLAILDLLMLNRGYQGVARVENPWVDPMEPWV